MHKTFQKLVIVLVLAGMVSQQILVSKGTREISDGPSDSIRIVTTTTLLTDLVSRIGTPFVQVAGLMGPGVDPHLYQASANDVLTLQHAEVMAYHGLHLEGQMTSVFDTLSRSGKPVICIEHGIPKESLIVFEDFNYDPHIWFDISLWKQAARYVAKRLGEIDSANVSNYYVNLERYEKELDELDQYVRSRIQEVPIGSRVLVTAHDAFNYFGREYGFEVRGLQGISTESEAGTADVSQLASFIAERKLKAIFIESSVPYKNIEALQDAVKARGCEVAIGGQLYSDALGNPDSEARTYTGMFKTNIDTIVNALK